MLKKLYLVERLDVNSCPFCGEHEELTMMQHKEMFFIRCECCNTTGPDGNEGESALIQWNTRETQPNHA